MMSSLAAARILTPDAYVPWVRVVWRPMFPMGKSSLAAARANTGITSGLIK